MDSTASTIDELTPITMTEQLAEMVTPIRHALEQAEARLEMIQTAEKAQRAEITKMRRALSVIDPDYQPVGKPRARKKGRVGVPRANGTATGFGISVERASDYARKILELTDAGATFVTQRSVYELLGADQTQSAAAFKFLREIEMIGKVGQDPSTRAERWKVLDRNAFDNFAATIGQATEEVAS